jgi:hypothetical protein
MVALRVRQAFKGELERLRGMLARIDAPEPERARWYTHSAHAHARVRGHTHEHARTRARAHTLHTHRAVRPVCFTAALRL